jgi:hypothetical protein
VLIEISVATFARCRAFTTTSAAAYRSCPALNSLPFVGAFAFALRNCTCSVGGASGIAAWAALIAWVGRCALMVDVARGVGVVAPLSEPRGRAEEVPRGVGSMTLVRLGRGEAGREGGSWRISAAGVEAVSMGEVMVEEGEGLERFGGGGVVWR